MFEYLKHVFKLLKLLEKEVLNSEVLHSGNGATMKEN